MEILISVKILIPEIFIIIFQFNNPTQNGFLCKTVQLSDFKLWHDLVTLKLKIWFKVFFKSRLLNCGYFSNFQININDK
jgi:hypothetical protein